MASREITFTQREERKLLTQETARYGQALRTVLHYVLAELGERLISEVNHSLAPLKITDQHYHLVLVVLADGGKIIQQDLASVLDLNQNRIVVLLDDLADDLGLVTRMRNPDNRRQHLLALTQKRKAHSGKSE